MHFFNANFVRGRFRYRGERIFNHGSYQVRHTSVTLTKELQTLEPLTKEPQTLEPLTKEPQTLEPLTKEHLTLEPLTNEDLTKEHLTMEPQNMSEYAFVDRCIEATG